MIETGYVPKRRTRRMLPEGTHQIEIPSPAEVWTIEMVVDAWPPCVPLSVEAVVDLQIAAKDTYCLAISHDPDFGLFCEHFSDLSVADVWRDLDEGTQSEFLRKVA